MKSIIYTEDINIFESFCDYNADEYIYIDNEPYFIDINGDLLKVNGGRGHNYIDLVYFTPVVNDTYSQTKAFDNVEFYFSNNNVDSSVQEIVFSTSNQSAVGDIFDNREGTHKLSIPRATQDKFADRLRDKYLVCKYVIDRTNEANNYFSIPYVKTKFRYSFI